MYDYWKIFGWLAAGPQARPDTAIAAVKAYQFAKLKLNFEKYRQSKQKRPSRPTNYTLLQVQLASAKLAICLKNSVFGFEKLSFFLGLRLSFFATFFTYWSGMLLKFDFLGIY